MESRLLFLVPPALITLRWLWTTFFAHNPLANVPGPKSPSFLTGHIRQLFSTHPGLNFQRDIVDKYGRVVLLNGAFGARRLYVADTRALHAIVVKHQDVFEEQPAFISWNKAVFGEGIISVLGAQHRKQRKILNPAFSVKNLRELVPVFREISDKLSDKMSEDARCGSGEPDLIVWFSKAALELIGVGGLGYSFNALDGDNHEYIQAIRFFNVSAFALMIPRLILPYVEHLGTQKLRRFLWQLIPWSHVHNVLRAADAMWKTTSEVYDRYSDCSADSITIETKFKEVIAANSIMMVLKRANQTANPAERLSDDEMKGQISSLVMAASVTTSRMLCRIIHQLILNPEWQARVRDEVVAAIDACAGELNYDQLEALPVLDAIVRETTRLYPPIPNMARICLQDTVVPLMHPLTGRDGSTLTEILVPAGTELYIGILPPNIDYATWGPDAREWKPERWLAPLPESVGEARIPGVFAHQMTFLAGNRACIGFKFSLLEMKVVLSTLLSKFRFSPGTGDIEWVHAGIYQPIIDGVMKPTMPVKIEELASSASA